MIIASGLIPEKPPALDARAIRLPEIVEDRESADNVVRIAQIFWSKVVLL
ncbi:MAG: hypothetical protein GY742_15625 [Hyphomicrobiales bacterium]|nr:hypothetical protein [Hyphomicrobiales bacterium]